jgi:hypothetical protein
MYLATTAGASGASQPVWPASGTVADGTVVWTMTPYTAVSIAEGSFDAKTSFIDYAATVFEGTVPGVSSCGNSPSLDAGSTRYNGTVTEGSGATGCAIALNFWMSTPKPRCVVSSPSGASLTTYSVTSNASDDYILTIVNPPSAKNGNNRFTWICQQ